MKIVILADQAALKCKNNNIPLIKECVEMFSSTVDPKDIYVQSLKSIEKNISDLDLKVQCYFEPTQKGTAPALGLIALRIAEENPHEIITVAYSDHPVNYKHKLLSAIEVSSQIAESSQKLILVGVNPTFPATNYGYVKIGKAILSTSGKILFELQGFSEKPDKKLAKEFLNSWQYLWNTGYLSVRADILLQIYKKYLPEIYKGLMNIKNSLGSERESQTIKEIFEKFDKISIDKGIYEKISKKDLMILSVDLNISNFSNTEE